LSKIATALLTWHCRTATKNNKRKKTPRMLTQTHRDDTLRNSRLKHHLDRGR